MTKKTIFNIIILVLVFVLGVFVGMIKKQSGNQLTQLTKNSDNTYQAGWDAAKKRIQEKGSIPMMTETKTLSGTVDKISGNSIMLKNVSTPNPLSDPSLDTRTVQITGDTKIYQITQKDPQQLQQEMADFQKKMQDQQANVDGANTSEPVAPPMFQERKETLITDIKEGQNISVISDADIATQAQFNAAEIDVQSQQ